MAKSMQGQTMRKKSKIKRIRKFGFMARMESWTGRNVLRRRREKKRDNISISNEFGTTNMAKNKKFSRRR